MSAVLPRQRVNTSKEPFDISSKRPNEILTAVMGSIGAQTEWRTGALDSPENLDGLQLALMNQMGLYQDLRALATSGCPRGRLTDGRCSSAKRHRQNLELTIDGSPVTH